MVSGWSSRPIVGGRLRPNSSLLSPSQAVQSLSNLWQIWLNIKYLFWVHRECPPKILVFNLVKGQCQIWLHCTHVSNIFPGNKLVASHVPPHNRHTLFKQIVVDLSHGPSDTFAYLSDYASGRVLTFRWMIPNTGTAQNRPPQRFPFNRPSTNSSETFPPQYIRHDEEKDKYKDKYKDGNESNIWHIFEKQRV